MGVRFPYDVVNPYSTCESAGSLVVHVIVAPEPVMLDADTLEIVGGVVSLPLLLTVTTIEEEVAWFPAASRATAWSV